MKTLRIGVVILIAGVAVTVVGGLLANTATYNCVPYWFTESCSYRWWYGIATQISSGGSIAIFVGLIVVVFGFCHWLVSRFRRR